MKTAAVIVFLTLGIFSSFQDPVTQGPQVPQESSSLPRLNGFCSEYKTPPSACTQENTPVCGNDGKTYTNKCYFCQEVFNSLGSLSFDDYGEC